MQTTDRMQASHDLITQMAALVKHWQEHGDQRAIFLDCYLRMTRRMQHALDAGDFADTAWVTQLLHRFAGYYFDALDAYEQGKVTPAVWRMAHDAARRTETMTLQHLFLGVNAHINYDLALVLVELLQSEWSQLDAAMRRRRYDDYTYVNAVIARTIDEVQSEVVERATPLLRVVDVALGRLDEWLTVQLISGWRDEVWRHALAMLEAADAARREEVRRAVEQATVQRAHWILGQPFAARR